MRRVLILKSIFCRTMLLVKIHNLCVGKKKAASCSEVRSSAYPVDISLIHPLLRSTNASIWQEENICSVLRFYYLEQQGRKSVAIFSRCFCLVFVFVALGFPLVVFPHIRSVNNRRTPSKTSVQSLEVSFQRATVTGGGPVTGRKPAGRLSLHHSRERRSPGVGHFSFIAAVNT